MFSAHEFPDAHPRVVAIIEALRALEQNDVQPRPSQWLDIIDEGLVTSGVKALYQREAEPSSVLRTTANGSLFWQRDAGPP